MVGDRRPRQRVRADDQPQWSFWRLGLDRTRQRLAEHVRTGSVFDEAGTISTALLGDKDPDGSAPMLCNCRGALLTFSELPSAVSLIASGLC